jgi:hypothetical protein
LDLRKAVVPPFRLSKEQRNQKLMQEYHRVMPKIRRDSVVLSLLMAGMMRGAATGEVLPDARVLILPQATIERVPACRSRGFATDRLFI